MQPNSNMPTSVKPSAIASSVSLPANNLRSNEKLGQRIDKPQRRPLAIEGAPVAFQQPLHVGCPVILDRQAFLDRVNGVLDRQWLTNNGQEVREFEDRIQQLLGVRHCVAVTNGTTALSLTAQSLDLTGEVILPSFTFIATAHAISSLGLTPVFADIKLKTACIDPESIESLITERTSAILAVHLWGRSCEIEKLRQLAKRHNLKLIFDASHAFCTTHHGRAIGNFGDAETFSFHATKYISAAEGGAITTNSDTLASKLRAARNFGFTGVDQVEHYGTNAKMNELCASMGNASLDSLEARLEINKRNFEMYRSSLANLPGIELQEFDLSQVNNFQYVVIRVLSQEFGADREFLLSALQSDNVLARRYFYPGCHRARPYSDSFEASRNNLPVTEQLASEVLSLPSGPSIGELEIRRIGEIIASVSQLARQSPDSYESLIPHLAQPRTDKAVSKEKTT